MEHVRYHLVFQSFKEGINKTEACFLLKSALSLSDRQVAEMMANRRCVLKSNLAREEAIKLGRLLSQKGLNLKAEALATHQKSSPDDLKKQLREGGLEQFFASRFRHTEDEFDTILSLGVLAALPALTYIILPLIGLLLLLPLISVSTWSQQPLAALLQLLFSLLLFVPAIILLPKNQPPQGLEVDPETEELLYQLLQGLQVYLAAPAIRKVTFVDRPVIAINQSPKQWLLRRCTLVIGLPMLEALTLHQLIGMLALELSPVSKNLYQRTWGFFLLWRSAVKQRNESWAGLLDNWVTPIARHQNERALAIAGQLVGFEQKATLIEAQKTLSLVHNDWPDFSDYCRQLNAKPVWQKFIKTVAVTDDSGSAQTSLRFNAPALWVLSTTEGYQKAIGRDQHAAKFTIAASSLWQHFQHYIQRRELFFRLGIEPLSLMPTKPGRKGHGKNAHKLNQQAGKILDCQYDKISVALGISKDAPCDLKAETLIWQQLSAPFWPAAAETDKLFPTARTAYQAIQLLLQMQQWLKAGRLSGPKQTLRNRQLSALQQNFSSLCQKLQPMPVLGGNTRSFADQLNHAAVRRIDDPLSAQEISQNLNPWLNLLTVYWITVSGRLLNAEPE
ncbi:hypothetical protein [Reinekea marinisedimentorum]|uniref:Uncharacterized protein n=1 Tax=Reinekea marinisedimentorum TaxID=230495 RepID=A0A4R3IBH2_9GAMM|nr:hypothetical protein [Reinekea marinisedimentorum]TCS43969.1 hypothetical protein BCF53_101312 [Reinekea marinisedimentorum]